MSLLSNFNNDLPLTPNGLVDWVKKLIPYEIDFSILDSLADSQNNSNVTSVLDVSTATEIYEHILNGGSIAIPQTTATGKSLIIPSVIWADRGGEPGEKWFGITWVDEGSSVFYKCKVDLYIDTNRNRVMLNVSSKSTF